MLSTWISPFTRGHADFYAWNGSFVRRVEAPGNLLASVDGRYFVNFTKGQLLDSTGTLVRSFTEPTAAENATSLNWAADGDYFCGLEKIGAGYALVVEDAAGRIQHIQLHVPPDLVPANGLRAMWIKCSLSANRAVVFGGSPSHPRAALMSLPDGKATTDFEFDPGYFAADLSPDLHWLAASNSAGPNGWTTEVVDTTKGTAKAKLDGFFGSFTPDGENLVGTDVRNVVTVVDWRTKTELWRGPGHLDFVMAQSDPATNTMLLWLSTGSAQLGTETYDYWIVRGTGSGFRFNPRDCVSIVKSPGRVCSFR
jgi:hypothetical protein